jgi:hypothetical protein
MGLQKTTVKHAFENYEQVSQFLLILVTKNNRAQFLNENCIINEKLFLNYHAR